MRSEVYDEMSAYRLWSLVRCSGQPAGLKPLRSSVFLSVIVLSRLYNLLTRLARRYGFSKSSHS